MSFLHSKSTMQKHSSSSHVKIHHRNDVTSHSYSQSHSSERKSVSQRDVFHASSSAPNRWHTATNSKGNLVIAKKTIAKEPKSADYSKAKKKIRYILTEYKKRIMDKKNTQLDDVDDWTSDIMKVCEKYKRGDYSAMQSSTKSAKAKEEAKKPKQGPAKQKSPAQPSTSQSSTITAKPKSKPNDKKNTEAETTAKKFEKRMTNEVMNLYKTYGLVVSQPTSKRTPKKVERFCDLDFDTPRTRSRTHRALHRPDETPKQVKPKQKKASPANAFKKPVSAFKVIENAPPVAAQNVKPSTSGTPNLVYQRKSTTQTTSTAVSTTIDRINNTTQTTIKKTQNFVHNNVRIFHMPMIELVKQEKTN